MCMTVCMVPGCLWGCCARVSSFPQCWIPGFVVASPTVLLPVWAQRCPQLCLQEGGGQRSAPCTQGKYLCR